MSVTFKPELSVVRLPCGNVNDIPSALRSLASMIESGTDDSDGFRGGVMAFAWVSLDAFGNTATGCLGSNIDKYKTVGVLQQGIIELLRGVFHEN